MIDNDRAKRAGLIATNSIRGGANREVLHNIKNTGDIYLAWSDQPWVLDGAAVRVSIVGFDDGDEDERMLDGVPVDRINSSLSALPDLSLSRPLAVNVGRSFMGTTKGGPFDISGELARSWLDLPNPSGKNNRDVLKPWVNGLDLTRRGRDMWIIDFDDMPEDEAAAYVAPFAYVTEVVRPARLAGRDAAGRSTWWQMLRSRPDMRVALEGLARFAITPRVAKHRLFFWLAAETLPDSATIVFATDQDYDFGILHSRVHEVWSLAQGTSLEDRPRYTPSTCFETFPFPEPTPDQRERIAAAAKHLDEIRNHLFSADDALTMTKLYNEVSALREHRDSTARAFPLLLAHERLDKMVAAAYGWEWPLDDDSVLSRLLGLNLAMA